jgi:hypothetical protein
MALDVVASEFVEKGELVVVFDALGNRREP